MQVKNGRGVKKTSNKNHVLILIYLVTFFEVKQSDFEKKNVFLSYSQISMNKKPDSVVTRNAMFLKPIK